MRYECRYIPHADEGVWERIPSMSLVGTVSGEPPRLSTNVQAYWDAGALHLRFDCEDDHVVATMANRDDPLYEEDVVEIFIDERGTGRRYLEFEVSPRNVLFDAAVTREDDGSISVDTAWNVDALQTRVQEGTGRMTYRVSIPFDAFEHRPEIGAVWRWNLYRIDSDPDGERHYWAWSPTGRINFHLPGKFGELAFTDGTQDKIGDESG